MLCFNLYIDLFVHRISWRQLVLMSKRMQDLLLLMVMQLVIQEVFLHLPLHHPTLHRIALLTQELMTGLQVWRSNPRGY